MAIVCRHLASYCKLEGKEDYVKTFKKFSKLFEKVYDKGRRNLCRIEVLEDYKNAKFQKDTSIEGSKYICVVDAKRMKLTILECLDGTTVIEFWNTKIEVPTRIVTHLEQVKQEKGGRASSHR